MRDSFQFCVDTAQAEGLEFLLIGGYAVNARGYDRTTVDVDFLIAPADLDRWRSFLTNAGFRTVHETRSFAQFEPSEREGFRVDVMVVDETTFAKLLAGSEWLEYGGRRVRVAGVLHLIALKLHATRTWTRAVQGKDFYDIVNLIRTNRVDTNSAEFLEILARCATPSIKERLLSDLQRDPDEPV